ncbi:hypothetical protein LINGRAHAP2_LOCUS14059 [Linum grandiflorum]
MVGCSGGGASKSIR